MSQAKKIKIQQIAEVVWYVPFTVKHQTVAVKTNTVLLFQELYPNIGSHRFNEESRGHNFTETG